MSTFQQLCPACDRLLELPAEAKGRIGKCPACEATFTIGEPQQSVVTDQPVPPEQPTPEQQTPAPPAPDQPARDQPVPAATQPPAPTAPPPANPFSAPLLSDVPDEFPTAPRREISYDRDPVAEFDAVQIVPRSIEEILSATLAIFAARWAYYLLGLFLAVILPAVLAGVYVNAVNALTAAGARGLAGLGIVIGIPLGIVILGYVYVGLARLALAIARNSPTPFKDSLPRLAIVGQFLAGVAVMAVVGALGFVLAAVVVRLISVISNPGLTGFASGLALIIGSGLSLAAFWLLWSWLLLVSDGRGRSIRSMRVAAELSRQTKLTSALMLLVALAISAFGAAMCYVGLLVTQPFLLLMFAVAYLLMTNQRIDDPRHAAAEL